MQLNEVKLFDTISPSQMAKYQKRDAQLSLVYECVANNSKPKLSEIHHVRSKPIYRLLLQIDQLSLIRGVLHHYTFKDDDEIQQLILPQCLCDQVLKSLHDDNGHQGLQVHHRSRCILKSIGLPCLQTLITGLPNASSV